MLAWVLVVGQIVVIVVGLCAIRSFGKWTKQLLRTNQSNELILHELRLINRPVFPLDAINHVAQFVSDDPPTEESA